MSVECGLCEVNLRCTALIASCTEADCPQRAPVDPARVTGPDARPLSELTYREMLAAYGDEPDEG
jgi:hypothetical protein